VPIACRLPLRRPFRSRIRVVGGVWSHGRHRRVGKVACCD
jgi:hypothetical protein